MGQQDTRASAGGTQAQHMEILGLGGSAQVTSFCDPRLLHLLGGKDHSLSFLTMRPSRCAANEEPNWALDAGVRGGSRTAEISACLSQTSCGHCWPLSVWHPCIPVTLSGTHPPPRHPQPWRGSGPPGTNSQRALQKCGQRASQGQDKPKGVVSSQRVHRGTLRGRRVLRGRGQVCFGLRAPGRWEQVGEGRGEDACLRGTQARAG